MTNLIRRNYDVIWVTSFLLLAIIVTGCPTHRGDIEFPQAISKEEYERTPYPEVGNEIESPGHLLNGTLQK